METKTHFIVIHQERFWRSLVSDAMTFGIGFALMGAGVLIGSPAMEWAGFIMFGISIWARAAGVKKRTPQEAADFLRDTFNVVAKPLS